MLRRFGIRPLKRFGQHFLVSQRALDQIVAAAALSEADAVLEIGAGLGTLTQALAARAGHVTAVELDRRLIPVLDDTLSAYPAARIVAGDVLKLPLDRLFGGAPDAPRKIVANLPYNIAATVLIRLLAPALRIERLVVTVQREVAERITASAGTAAYGRLSIAIQFRGAARVVCRIPRGAFLPPPDVDSAVVQIVPSPEPRVAVPDADEFFRIVAAGFGQRRKTLLNALTHGLGLPAGVVATACAECGIEPGVRAERLGLDALGALARALHPVPGRPAG
ncbi:MAG TPA: 16S rRNA (adenine(1518)-N(6)/adenine(1519)-N(6))-dimethyltransferase RsmA [bacterium]|nr:16S rRNA (adenine(1518)-N(6)/adenine(1519)-N(6))-dimethyltransferase RsmA [bacterium]